MTRRGALFVPTLVFLASIVMVGAVEASTSPARRLSVPVTETGRYIVELRAGTDTQAFINEFGLSRDGMIIYRSIFPGFAGAIDGTTMARIAADSRVSAIDADEIIRGAVTRTTGPVVPNAQDSGVVPVGLDRLDQRNDPIDRSYTYSNDGTGVDVYLLDTGVYSSHSEFGSRIANGWSYRASDTLRNAAWSSLGSCKTNGPSVDYVYDATAHPFDVDTFDHPTLASDITAAQADVGKTDNEGHGTHVAGIIGGTTTGVAPGVTIYPVRILNSCGNGIESVANAGLDWVATHHTTGRAVVNMSIGFKDRPTNFEQKVATLMAEGVVVVAASGNGAASSCNFAPAGTPGTISVGAVAVGPSATSETWYSNFGSCVDIFAPGGAGAVSGGYPVGTTSAWLDASNTGQSPYMIESGTSMAAPHVSGVVAQWLQGLATSPVSKATGPDAAWAWLKKQATCGVVTYFSSDRTDQTPNRLLNTGSPPTTPCAPRKVTVTQASGSSVVSWDALVAGNGNDITGYKVSTNPATAGCTATEASVDPVTGRAQCTLSGLADGTTYAVSVKATYGVGLEGTAATTALVAGVSGVATTAPPTTTTVPELVAPATATTSSTSRSITINWPATAPAGSVVYVVTISPTGTTCTTASTTCIFEGVSTGANYTFSISVKNASGAVSGSALKVTVTAGVTQALRSVKVGSRNLLSRIVKTVSKGTRTYTVTSGRCRISTGRLVAPATAGTCKVRMSVARSSTYRAFRTTLTVAVTK